MEPLLTVLRVLVAAAFVAAALVKLVLPPAALARVGMQVVAGLPRRTVVAVAALEGLGAAGLLAPSLLGAPPTLARLAAAGLAALMVGASWLQVTHRRSLGAAISIAMLTLAAALAVTPGTPLDPL
ncbi:MAG: DoxX family protein [Trueperaceae bacterium]|nr:DoxX family protein [Trueperaceae bacterium]